MEQEYHVREGQRTVERDELPWEALMISGRWEPVESQVEPLEVKGVL